MRCANGKWLKGIIGLLNILEAVCAKSAKGSIKERWVS